MDQSSPYQPITPPRHSAGFGALRIRILDAVLAHQIADGEDEDPIIMELRKWSLEVRARARGTALGLMAEGVPASWKQLLADIGVPLGANGEMVWGRDMREDPTLSTPRIVDDVLQLPAPQVLEKLTSLALKPVRLFVADRVGCRLQIATQVHFYLWENQTLLVSCALVPAGGFLYGPLPGQRHSLSIPPGGYQFITW